jgi:hypothetical protein
MLIVGLVTGLLVGYVVGQAQVGEPWEEVERLKAEKENLLDTYLQYKDTCFILKEQLENMTTKLYSLQVELTETNAEYEALQLSYAELKDEYDELQRRPEDAEATIADLEEKITELSHNLGILVKELIGYNVTLNCSLPRIPEEAPVLRVHKVPVNQSVAVEIATNVFGFEEIDGVEGLVKGGLTVKSGDKRLRFFSLHDIFYNEIGNRYTIGEWSENETLEIANELLERLYDYWGTSELIEVSLHRVGPSSISIVDGFTTVHEIGVLFRQTVHGIELWGPGADFSVCIANDRVVGVELHRPVLTIEGYDEIKVSPMEAIKRAMSGESAMHELGFEILGSTARNLTISDIRLLYFSDFLGNQTHLPLVYCLKGFDNTYGRIYEEYIFATERHS